jgi:cytoskeletal protein RodZ
MVAFKTRKIESAKTLGQRLEACRRRKKLSLDDVEEATKIRTRYLTAIERDDYKSLPGPVYLVGFLASYAEFLNLDPEEIVGQFKTEYKSAQKDNSKQSSFAPGRKIADDKFTITPKVLIWFMACLGILTLFVYVGWQVKRFSTPPPVEITAPKQDVVTDTRTTIIGQTLETANVTINGQTVTVDSEGKFSQEIGLRRGINTIEIKATNRIGRQTVKTLKLFSDTAVQANPPNQP